MRLVILLFYAYLAIFPFGQLTRIPFSPSGFTEINFYLTDLLVFLTVFIWLGKKLMIKEKFKKPSLWLPISLFSLISLVSLIFNTPLLKSKEVIISCLYLIRWLAYAGLYFVVYDLIRRQELKLKTLLKALISVGSIAAVLGLLQYFLVPDTRFLEIFGWDPHHYRVIGTFLDPGFLGLILVLSIIIITVRAWQEKKKRNILISAGIITYLALALTYSRASYLAYLFAMGGISWWKRSVKFFLVVLGIGLITIILLPRPEGEGVKLERESTIEARILNWQQSFEIAQDNLLLGVGFNAYRYAQNRYQFFKSEEELKISHSAAGADSSLLFVLATTGIIGLGIYLWLWIKAFLLCLKGNMNLINQIALLSIFAIFIHALFVNSLFYSWIMAWLWIVLGGVKEKR